MEHFQSICLSGKHHVTADTPSRARIALPEQEDKLLVEEVEAISTQATAQLPATANLLQEIRDTQKIDEECTLVRSYCIQGWPAYMSHQPLIRPYWESRSHLTIVDHLLLYDDRIVVPRSMRLQILDCIHTGHLGITKCRSRVRTSVWSPSSSFQQHTISHVTSSQKYPQANGEVERAARTAKFMFRKNEEKKCPLDLQVHPPAEWLLAK